MGKTQGNLKEKARIDLQEPRKFKVIIHNDDFTTMDFVVEVLQKVFRYDRQNAEALMLTVHKEGKATVGIYSRDIAQTKVSIATKIARDNNFPLKLTYEPV